MTEELNEIEKAMLASIAETFRPMGFDSISFADPDGSNEVTYMFPPETEKETEQ